jgi:exonuclease SbcD
VGGLDVVRYSGSPLALSFSEAGDEKSVVVVELKKKGGVRTELLPVPVRRVLTRVKAGRGSLEADLAVVAAGSWAEVVVRLEAPEMELDRVVREVAGGRFEVLKVLAELPVAARQAWQHAGPVLSELRPREVFAQLLADRAVEDAEVVATFDELLALREARETE